MRKATFLLLMAVLAGPAGAQLFGEKKTPDEQRDKIRSEHAEILKKVIAEKPEVEEKIKTAPGYATFSSVNVNLLVVSSERGAGVVMDSKSGEEIFMNVTSIGGGLGAGIKDLKALLIFNDHSTLRKFVDSGWQFAAQADATLKSDEKGGAIGESVAVAADESGEGVDTALSSGAGEATQADTDIEVYRITEAGIALQATVAGTKYSKNKKLNE